MNINKIQFANTKLCISGSQDQEKGNVVTNLGCWGITHTIFATGLYGAHTPGNWYIENVNIAGFVNRLVYNSQQGYFASHFRNIFSESLGRFGTIYSNQGTTVESSELGFAWCTDAGQYIFPQIDCSGVNFIGCNMRMYGTFKPVTITGASTYIGCSFETVPFADYTFGNYPSFIECRVGGYPTQLGVSGVRNMYSPAVSESLAYGTYTIAAGPDRLAIDNACPGLAYPVRLNGMTTPLNITEKGGVRSATVPLAADEAGRVKPGDIIGTSTGDKIQGLIGTVTAVTSTDFTISWLSSWVGNGQRFALSIFLPLYNMTFLGDMTAGSNRITHVKADFGTLDKFITHGGLMVCNKFINTGYNQTWRASLFRILAYDASAGTITLDQKATQTVQGVYFSNENATKDLHVEDYEPDFDYLNKYGLSEILQEGGQLYVRESATGKTVHYLVTKSGFYNAAANHDTRQAEWVREDKK